MSTPLIGGVAGVVAAAASGCGAGWPARCSGAAGRAVASGSCSGVLGPAAGSPVRPRRRVADPAAPQLPGAGGFYAALALLAGAGRRRSSARRAGRIGAASRRRGAARGGRATPELRPLRSARAIAPHRAAGARTPRRAAAARRAPPRAGRVRPAAVGQVGRAGDPGAARVARAGGRVARSRPTCSAATITRRRRARRGVRVRPVRALGRDGRTRGRRCTAPTRGTARSRSRGGWRAAGELDQRSIEGGDFWAVAAEQRLAPAAVRGRGHRGRDRHRRALGLRPGDARARRGAVAVAGERATRRARGRPRGLRRRARVRGAGRPDAHLDRGDRAGAAARLPVRAASPARRQSCEITADRLLDGAATLYLIGDAKASKLLRPIFLALLGEVVDRAYERATLAGGRLELPLLLCLDEAGNVAPLPNLAEIASTAPSHNIQLVSIFHDLAQARSRYGQQAETVVNSHRARMLLPGVADLETLRYFAGLVGEEEARDLTRTRPAPAGPRARPRAAAGRWSPPRRSASFPSATRCCSTAGSRRPACDCGCGSRIVGCGGSQGARHEPARARGLATSPTDDWEEPVSARWPLGWRGAVSARAVDVVRAAVGRRVRAARALPPGRCAAAGGRTRSRSRRWPRWRPGSSATTRASGTTRPASWRCSTTSSASRALLRDGGEPFHPDRDRLAFARYLVELGCQPPPDR